MKTSSNYGLKLMEGTDNVKRQDFVDNFTKIDSTMKTIDNKHSAYGTTSGTNTYTVSIAGITSLYDGLKVTVKIGTASTGASTLNINGLGAKPILDGNGNAITSGGLKASIPYQLCYNGKNFIVLGKGGGGNATPSQVLAGKTFTNDSGEQKGTMVERGNMSSTLKAGESFTIPEGHHGGGGKITANSLASQTQGTAGAGDIRTGKTAIVNGNKVTGTMANKDNATTAWCGFEQISLQTHPNDSTQGLVTLVPQYGSGLYGYYGAGSKITGNIAGLNPSNIKAGAQVGRNNGDSTNCITGTFTSDATAQAGHILSGQTAYVNGNKITGNITIYNDGYTPSECGVYSNYLYQHLPIGYFTGAETRLPLSSLANILGITSNKIVSGANICGVNGSANAGDLLVTGTLPNIGMGASASVNLPFTPRVVFATYYNGLSGTVGGYEGMVYSNNFPYLDNNNTGSWGQWGHIKITFSGTTMIVNNTSTKNFVCAGFRWCAIQ